MGLEPMTYCVTGNHPNQLDQQTIRQEINLANNKVKEK